MASFTLQELAYQLGCQLVGGNPQTAITGVSTVEKAGEDEITFLANLKYAPKLKTTRAAAVIAAEPLVGINAATVVSPNPYHDFARGLALFHPPVNRAPGIHPFACIAVSVVLGPGASV